MEIEEERDRLAGRQAAKARLTAALNRSGRHTFDLVITNLGPGVARNILVKLDGKRPSEHPAARVSGEDKSKLAPDAAMKFAMLPSLGSPLPVTVRVEWEDDSGEDGLYESGL